MPQIRGFYTAAFLDTVLAPTGWTDVYMDFMTQSVIWHDVFNAGKLALTCKLQD